LTYYRENKPLVAREEFRKVDAEAHLASLPVQEAEFIGRWLFSIPTQRVR